MSKTIIHLRKKYQTFKIYLNLNFFIGIKNYNFIFEKKCPLLKRVFDLQRFK